MGSNVSLAEASIVDNTGHDIADRTAITVRLPDVTLRSTGDAGPLTTTRNDVASVEPMGPGSWRVGFTDGTWWTVTRKGRGCGCGGRR